jgi:diguanylate cyclase (GGDEF)-like protein
LASVRDLLGRTETVLSAQQALEGLIALAFTDPTTRLYNRRAFDEIANLSLGFEGPVFGAVMIDLTGFKRVNDEGSHAAGNAALGEVGRTLTDICKATDSSPVGHAFRYGGDEFCVLVPAQNFEAFVSPANLGRLRWPKFSVEGKALGFGASVGFAPPDEDAGLTLLTERADLAASISKHRSDEPVRWSSDLKAVDLVTSRRRCQSCSTTVAIQGPRQAIKSDFFDSCRNCGVPLE